MTTITINLLLEERLAQQAAARNPMKIAILIGAGVLGVMVLIGVLLGFRASQTQQEAAVLATKWASMQSTQSGIEGMDTKSLQAVADDYLAVNQSRPIFAPQLALIKDIIPDSIQLTQIRFSLVTETTAGCPSPEPKTEKETASDGTTEPKPPRPVRATTSDRLTLVLEGSTTCARPEIEVDDFLKSLRGHPEFSKVVQDIRLRSIARSSGKPEDGITSLPTAQFVIDCTYREKK